MKLSLIKSIIKYYCSLYNKITMSNSNKVNWNINDRFDNVNSITNVDIAEAINAGNLNKVKILVESKGYTSANLNNTYVDTHKNTFLHLAIMNNNIYITNYFLEKGIRYDKQNKLGQSPWDIAIAFRYGNVIEKIIEYRIKTENLSERQISQMSTKLDLAELRNKELKRTCVDHESTIQIQKSHICDLTNKYNLRSREFESIKTENMELRSSNKRLRDTNENLITENRELKEANKKLKTSVEILMENTKK